MKKPDEWTILALGLIVLSNAAGLGYRDNIATQKRRIETLEADIVQLNLNVHDARLAIDPLQPQIDAIHAVDMQRCRDRTLCLRATLETLIKVWPGRARVPETCGDWPDWPVPGENLEHDR